MHLFSQGDWKRSGTCGPGNLDLRNSLLGPAAQTFDLGPSQPLLPQKAPNSMFVLPPGLWFPKAGSEL